MNVTRKEMVEVIIKKADQGRRSSSRIKVYAQPFSPPAKRKEIRNQVRMSRSIRVECIGKVYG